MYSMVLMMAVTGTPQAPLLTQDEGFPVTPGVGVFSTVEHGGSGCCGTFAPSTYSHAPVGCCGYVHETCGVPAGCCGCCGGHGPSNCISRFCHRFRSGSSSEMIYPEGETIIADGAIVPETKIAPALPETKIAPAPEPSKEPKSLPPGSPIPTVEPKKEFGKTAVPGPTTAAAYEPSKAYITVNVPPNATMRVNGEAVNTGSSVRVVATPELKPGMVGYYTVVAEITRDGKTYTATDKVGVEAGSKVSLTLNP